MSIRLKCKATKLIYQNGDFYIYAMSPITPYPKELEMGEYFTFTCKGDGLSWISLNKEYEIEVEEDGCDKKGVTNYKIVAVPSIDYHKLEHLSYDESMEILSEITTESQSKYLLDAYDNFIWLALTEGKDAIDVSKIYNVGEFRINCYLRELNVKYKYLNIQSKFKDYKVDIPDCKKLCDKYKDEDGIRKALQDNPYFVNIEVLERGFEHSDKLIMEVRNDLKDSKIRCEALMVHVLKLNESQSGNSLLHGNVLWKYMKDTYKVPELLGMVKDVACDSELIYYNEDTSNLTLMSTYIGECKVADFVKEKLSRNKKLNIDHTKYTEIKDGTLTEEQSNILKTICDSNIAIINAKGGTGKTSVLCATVEMFEDNHISYLLLSPTGRVANRIKEQTNGKFAQTIHKACLSCGESGLWVDAIFVEEFSMVSLDLMCMLINSISNPDCRIYFNGHLGQIAPIGVGCPMRDMIDSGIVPVCSLSKVFRYGEGGLYKMATDADDGKFYIGQLDYKNKDRVSIGANKDYTYVRYNGEVDQVIDEYARFIKRGIKPIDIAIITPWNVTDFGCINLSNKIQQLVNPSVREDDFVERKIRDFKVLFKVQDLIMNTKNCYSVMTVDSYNAIKKDKRLTKDDVSTVGCMNGEIGRIVDIDNGNIIAKFNEELLVFDKPLQNNLLLAYSCTSYKLQGSECPYIITLVTPQFKDSLNKNLIYTDMSRARKEVVEIIDPTTLAERIIIDATQERKTNLKELLLNGN